MLNEWESPSWITLIDKKDMISKDDKFDTIVDKLTKCFEMYVKFV